MNDNDPADLDGDGRFDATDISIMEGDRGDRRPVYQNGNGGCCIVLLLVLGSAFGAGYFIIDANNIT